MDILREAEALLARLKLHAAAWKMVDDALERAQGKSESGARRKERRARGRELARAHWRWTGMKSRVLTDEAIARAQARCRSGRGDLRGV